MLFVSGGPAGVLKYQPGETLTAAVADELQTVPETTQTLNDSGQNVTSVNARAAALRSRIDLHDVRVRRDGKTLGPFDVAALQAAGDPGAGPRTWRYDRLCVQSDSGSCQRRRGIARRRLSRDRRCALGSDRASGRLVANICYQSRAVRGAA